MSLVARIGLAVACLAAAASVAAVEPGETAKDFLLPTFDAVSVNMADYRGRVVLVDFWASWCSPCRQSLPLYNQLRTDFPASDFAILAINLDENAADARAFLTEHPVSYMTLQDPQGDVAKSYDLKGMPSSYLIDGGGIVRARHIGFKPEDINTLKQEIGKLITLRAHAS